MSIFSILFQLIWGYYKTTDDLEQKYLVYIFFFSVFYTASLFQLVIHINPELYSREIVSSITFKSLVISPQYLTMLISAIMLVTEAISMLKNKIQKKEFYKSKYNVKFIRGFYQNRTDLLKRYQRQNNTFNLILARDLLGKNQYIKYKIIKNLIQDIVVIANIIFIICILFPAQTYSYYLIIFAGFMLVLSVILIKYSKYSLFPDFKSIIICYNFHDDIIKQEITNANYLKLLFKINYKYKLNLLNNDNNNYFRDSSLIKNFFDFDMRVLNLPGEQVKSLHIGIKVIENDVKVYFLKRIQNKKTQPGSGIHNHV
jgi:hypothetical protein